MFDVIAHAHRGRLTEGSEFDVQAIAHRGRLAQAQVVVEVEDRGGGIARIKRYVTTPQLATALAYSQFRLEAPAVHFPVGPGLFMPGDPALKPLPIEKAPPVIDLPVERVRTVAPAQQVEVRVRYKLGKAQASGDVAEILGQLTSAVAHVEQASAGVEVIFDEKAQVVEHRLLVAPTAIRNPTDEILAAIALGLL